MALARCHWMKHDECRILKFMLTFLPPPSCTSHPSYPSHLIRPLPLPHSHSRTIFSDFLGIVFPDDVSWVDINILFK